MAKSYRGWLPQHWERGNDDQTMPTKKRASSETCANRSCQNGTRATNERSKTLVVTFAGTEAGRCADRSTETTRLLKEWFRCHGTGTQLDAERFLHSQTSLALDSLSKFDRMQTMNDFLNLVTRSTNATLFENFCNWQLDMLKKEGSDERQALRVIEENLKRRGLLRSRDEALAHRPLPPCVGTNSRWKGSDVIEQAGMQSLAVSKSREYCAQNAKEVSGQSKDSLILKFGNRQPARPPQISPESKDSTEQCNGIAGVDDFWKETVREYERLDNKLRGAIEKKSPKNTKDENGEKSIKLLPPLTESATGKGNHGEKSIKQLAPVTDDASRKENHGEKSIKQLPPVIDRARRKVNHADIFGIISKEIPDTRDLVNPSISSLALCLTSNTTTDEQRAWNIFAWVCNNIAYDVEGFRGRAPRKPCDAESVLKGRLCVCEGYARIFQSLCEAGGLSVEFVCGNARTRDSFGRKEAGDGGHAWNAVKLSGQWYLVDCTWGAGTCSDTKFTAAFRPHFFCIDPRALAFSHYPHDENWQLLPKAVSLETFDAQVHVWTADFFGHGLQFTPEERPAGKIVLKDTNQGHFKLKVPQDVELLVNIDGLEERCFQSREGNVVTIWFRMQTEQQFLTVYARRQQTSTENFAAVCKFIIVGSVGVKGCLAPWFPKVWQEPFRLHGLQFLEVLPNGLLRPDRNGKVSFKLKVPAAKKVIANLQAACKENVRTCTDKVEAVCKELDPGVVEISCDKIVKGFIGDLCVYANDRSASSFAAVISLRVEG